jgi:DNA-binding GntR family transcriptional regulator
MSALSQQVYDELRRRLAAGVLDGGPLSEPTLAKDLGVSRTPVREAIRRLEAERLLEQKPKRGTYVRRPDAREIDELFELRCLVEPNAAARAAENRGEAVARSVPAVLHRMKAVLDKLRVADGEGSVLLEREHASLDLDFHRAILEAAGNRTITALASSVGMLARALAVPKDSSDRVHRRLVRAHREHKAIWEAIRAGSPAEASAEMLAHLTHGRRTAAAYFAEQAPTE